MKMKKCKSCKSEIHPDAKICPHCRTKQKMGFIAKVIWLIIGLSVFMTIFKAVAPSQPREPEKPKTEAQIAAEKRKVELQDKAIAAIQSVKRNLKNPDSYQQDKVGITADETVCITYHATNSFNAVIPGIAYARKGTVSSDQAGFQKHCSKPMMDYLDFF